MNLQTRMLMTTSAFVLFAIGVAFSFVSEEILQALAVLVALAQDEEVDIRVRVQLAATVATDRYQRYAVDR